MDEPWIQAVARDLDVDPRVDAAWLFGSKALGHDLPESDTDIAILLSDAVPESERLRVQLELLGLISPPHDGSRLDVAILNDATPTLAVEVLEHGRKIFARSEQRARNFVVSAFRTYWD